MRKFRRSFRSTATSPHLKQAQAEIAAREAHLRSILDTVPEAMVVIDEGGVVTSFSSAATQLFGYDPEEVIGRNVKMLMPGPIVMSMTAILADI